MALVKTEGLIIRTMPMGETSKLVTFFTRELGILKIVAKGVRSSKSRIGAALELLAVSRIVYYEKENRDLQFLSQADLVEFFPNLPTDLEKWGYANACAELVYRAPTSAEATAKLYPILLNTLRGLNEKTAAARLCFWGFQMKLLSVLGLAPNLRKCLNCNNASIPLQSKPYDSGLVSPDTNSIVYHFDIARGGFLCNNCSPGRSTHEITVVTLQHLNALQTLPAEKFSHTPIPPFACREIENLLRAYFAFHLEEIGKLSALKFVREITG